MRNNKRKGFTLVELLVVIAILAILATVSIVGYTAFIAKANQSNANTVADQVGDYLNANILSGDDYYFPIEAPEAPEVDDTYDVYYVKAADGLVYKLVSTCTVADDPATADVDETVWTLAAAGTAVEAAGDVTAVITSIEDFADLEGTFTAVEGDITYEYDEEGEVTAAVDLG